MSMSDRARATHDALQASISAHQPDLDDRAAVLVGYVVVAEWSDERGERWLSTASAPDMPSWAIRGLLHEALYFPAEDDS